MNMRLYRMELYKLLYKKNFRFGLLAVLGILLAYFLLVSVGGERTTINGELYTGFAAVREDRRITEKFRGVLTDEKARQIIEQYGFPSKVEENYGGFRDENYLNGFVTEQLGNGYYFSWDDYQISTALQPLAESGLGAAARAAGREVLLDYAEGWGVFLAGVFGGTPDKNVNSSFGKQEWKRRSCLCEGGRGVYSGSFDLRSHGRSGVFYDWPGIRFPRWFLHERNGSDSPRT